MFVDAFYDRKKDIIKVVERVNGIRVYKDYKPTHTFYYEHPNGSYRSIFGDQLKKFETTDIQKFRRELDIVKGIRPDKSGKIQKPKKIFESDINPIFRTLHDNYANNGVPDLNIAFFDIEVEADPEKGFAPTDNPFNKVNAISVFCRWKKTLFTYALCPPSMTLEEAQKEIADIPNTFVFEDEKEVFDAFVECIDDADILSGWSSSQYDIPYLVNRSKILFDKDYARQFSLWNIFPRDRVYKKFNKEVRTYETIGRCHLDYLELYKKHNQQQLHSYRLDYVGEIEIGENKIPYDGTLDALWKQDFRKFVEYNRQDTALLDKIDLKRKYIELANQIAHANCVLLKTTTGSVALVEQAIINETHAFGFIVPTRKKDMDEDDEDVERNVVGAYVADPRKGIHEHVGACDINSLYPNCIIALNASTDTIIGQFTTTETDAYISKKVAEGSTFADAWSGLFHNLEYGHIMDKDNTVLEFVYDDGRIVSKTAADWYDYIFDPVNKVCISANATMFRTDVEGMIPKLLSKWYAERKAIQANEKKFHMLANGISLEEAAKIPDIETLITEYNLEIIDERLVPKDSKPLHELSALYAQRSLAKKILLNSLYGALLNEVCRFYDARMGQSVTLTGRSIVKHMTQEINYIITGDRNHSGKAIVYNDTDSTAADTIIKTSHGDMTIEKLFELCSIKWNVGDKQYSTSDMRVLGYSSGNSSAKYGTIDYVYRHKVSKPRWKITSLSGETVDITSDHSAMIKRNGQLIEAKPSEIQKDDILVISNDGIREIAISKIECIGTFDDEYVYDIGMTEDPYFFGNNILLHNSCYFSAYEALKDDPDFVDFEWSRENIIEMYDGISDTMNMTFSDFMLRAFNSHRGDVIKAGRELIASKGLFIKKKKYAVLMYDKEGERLDKNKPGKLKAMGLDLKRSDTPKIMQNFLEKILMMVLTDSERDDVATEIKQFRKEFSSRPGWEKGTPKAVNGLDAYALKAMKSEKKVNMPGHVRASLNWNKLCEINNDKISTKIADNSKVIVCKLKPNVYAMTSVAYPIDQMILPDWFKTLPFDDSLMEETIIDMKVQNLFGVLGWDFSHDKERNDDDLFVF